MGVLRGEEGSGHTRLPGTPCTRGLFPFIARQKRVTKNVRLLREKNAFIRGESVCSAFIQRKRLFIQRKNAFNVKGAFVTHICKGDVGPG